MTVTAPQSYASLEDFYDADPRRRVSAEWDYGVLWHGERPFPCHRVTWVVDTGEVYAFRMGAGHREGTVVVLGVVPAVGGRYPWPNECHARGESWDSARDAFRDAQRTSGGIDDVLEGWADECGKPDSLDWVRARVASVNTNTEVAA